jgi:hypothetical protein
VASLADLTEIGAAQYGFDLVLHNGDLAYASTAYVALALCFSVRVWRSNSPHSMPAPNASLLGAAPAAAGPVGDEWEWVWDLFCEQIAPIARQVRRTPLCMRHSAVC